MRAAAAAVRSCSRRAVRYLRTSWTRRRFRPPSFPQVTNGGATPSSTRSTSVPSPTATATARATSPGCASACRTSNGSVSTRCGSTRGTGRRCATVAMTSPTTARSTSSSARPPRPNSSSPRPRSTASASWSTSCRTTARRSTCGSRRRWRQRRDRPSAPATTSSRAGATTVSCRRTTGARCSAGPRGPASTTDSGTCTSSTRVNPTSTGSTPRWPPSSRRSCASGSIVAPPGSASTSPTRS